MQSSFMCPLHVQTRPAELVGLSRAARQQGGMEESRGHTDGAGPPWSYSIRGKKDTDRAAQTGSLLLEDEPYNLLNTGYTSRMPKRTGSWSLTSTHHFNPRRGILPSVSDGFESLQTKAQSTAIYVLTCSFPPYLFVLFTCHLLFHNSAASSSGQRFAPWGSDPGQGTWLHHHGNTNPAADLLGNLPRMTLSCSPPLFLPHPLLPLW